MLNNLKAELSRKGLTARDVALFLKKRDATIYDKMNGHYSFSFEEALSIRDRFFPEFTLEYLFKKENQLDRKEVI
ncbi:XRE family transcriptional regulator [Neobacillus mesonae]|uniref:XRE family transcriptional regulator n=1 Tax=Neobacillus mesonae TaxID=1193713 RepID=UPI002E2030B2|nr:XRE family transcriptional regulator [Neobacillus mesonae]